MHEVNNDGINHDYFGNCIDSLTQKLSQLGELHLYYLRVKSKDCGQRHKIENVHDSIERILSQISVSAQTLNLYKKMLEKLFDKNDFIRLDEIERTQNEIDKQKELIIYLQDQLMVGNISFKDFHPMKERTEKNMTVPITIGMNSN